MAWQQVALAPEPRCRQLGVADGDRRYNLTWHDWLNLESLVDISEVIAVSALARENSRGAHFREDFPEPGDLETSAYTRVASAARLTEMVPVTLDIVRFGHRYQGARRVA